VEIGPLVSRPHFDRVRGFLDRARNAGIQAAVGGFELEGPGFFVAPTVLINVKDDAEVAREEIFGPVVTVETFADEAEAVTRANSVPYGLSASVWTENARRSHDIAARLDPGTVWVNAPTSCTATKSPLGWVQGFHRARSATFRSTPSTTTPHQTRHAQPRPLNPRHIGPTASLPEPSLLPSPGPNSCFRGGFLPQILVDYSANLDFDPAGFLKGGAPR
jgi:aminobutyraldehyde dehydrogenase